MVITQKVEIKVSQAPELIKITGQAERMVQSHQLKEGTLQIWISGHSVGLLELPCPAGETQSHVTLYDDLSFYKTPSLKASVLGQTLSFPVIQSKLELDPWQEIILVSFHTEAQWHHLTFQMTGEI